MKTERRCQGCREPLAGAELGCAGCAAAYHAACWGTHCTKCLSGKAPVASAGRAASGFGGRQAKLAVVAVAAVACTLSVFELLGVHVFRPGPSPAPRLRFAPTLIPPSPDTQPAPRPLASPRWLPANFGLAGPGLAPAFVVEPQQPMRVRLASPGSSLRRLELRARAERRAPAGSNFVIRFGIGEGKLSAWSPPETIRVNREARVTLFDEAQPFDAIEIAVAGESPIAFDGLREPEAPSAADATSALRIAEYHATELQAGDVTLVGPRGQRFRFPADGIARADSRLPGPRPVATLVAPRLELEAMVFADGTAEISSPVGLRACWPASGASVREIANAFRRIYSPRAEAAARAQEAGPGERPASPLVVPGSLGAYLERIVSQQPTHRTRAMQEIVELLDAVAARIADARPPELAVGDLVRIAVGTERGPRVSRIQHGLAELAFSGASVPLAVLPTAPAVGDRVVLEHIGSNSGNSVASSR